MARTGAPVWSGLVGPVLTGELARYRGQPRSFKATQHLLAQRPVAGHIDQRHPPVLLEKRTRLA